MANRDAEIVVVVELMTSECTSEGTVVEWEVDNSDFVRSSGWIACPHWVVATASHVER
jgi:hypothetical protein